MVYEEISRTLRNQKKLNPLNYEWDLGMIIKIIKLFLQNVCKNRFLTNMILKTNRDFDIIFIQEPSWSTICTIPSLFNKEEDKVVSIANYLNWITFSRSILDKNNYSRVISYINICLANLHFSLYNNIFNYRNILSQIRYSLVVILGLNSVSEVQYKGMMTDR